MLLEEEAEVVTEEEAREEEASESGEEEETELETVDINITLLEAMIQRTEILEKLVNESISAAEANKLLAEIAVPSTTRRRRRRR